MERSDIGQPLHPRHRGIRLGLRYEAIPPAVLTRIKLC